MSKNEKLSADFKPQREFKRCIYCGCVLSTIQIKKGYDKCDSCTDKLENGRDMYQ